MTIQITTLSNGLRVATDVMPQVETASLGIWIGAGARSERAEENGVAHFLEHMAFKGTKTRNARQIAATIESVGGFLNAYTSRERTAYYAKTLKEHVPLALEVLADILLNSVFAAEELEKERGVILQEIGMYQDTPDDLVFEHFQETAFPDQPVGRSILGPAEIIKSMPREAFQNFIDTHYAPHRMVLSVAGNVQHDEIVALAEKFCHAFGPKSPPVWQPTVYGGGEHRTDKKLEQVHMLLGFPGLPYGHDDYYTQHMLSAVLSGGMSARLFQEIREKRGLVYSIYSFVSSYQDAGMFSVYAGTGEKLVKELVPVLCNELQAVGQSVEEEEMASARAQLKSSLLMGLESTSKRAEQLAQQLLVFDRPIPTEEMVEKIEAVTIKDLQTLAQKTFTQSPTSQPPTLAAIGPLSHLEELDKIQARLVA